MDCLVIAFAVTLLIVQECVCSFWWIHDVVLVSALSLLKTLLSKYIYRIVSIFTSKVTSFSFRINLTQVKIGTFHLLLPLCWARSRAHLSVNIEWWQPLWNTHTRLCCYIFSGIFFFYFALCVTTFRILFVWRKSGGETKCQRSERHDAESHRFQCYKLRALSHFIHDAIQMLESDSFNR